jgi:hypothetical protein
MALKQGSEIVLLTLTAGSKLFLGVLVDKYEEKSTFHINS